MSIISKLFKKGNKPVKPMQNRAADRRVPTRSGGDAVSQLRHQARTGGPKLSGKHRSGTF